MADAQESPRNLETDITDETFQNTTEAHRTIYEYLGFGCSLAMITVSVIGAVGNGYAVWHFGRPLSKSSVNVLLTALSAFDLILLCAGGPMYSLLGIYSFDRQPSTLAALAYCMTALYPFSNMAQMGSVWTMCLISFERYLGVCHPFVARRELTVRRARVAVIIVALIAVLYNMCRFWEYEVDAIGYPVALLRMDSIYLTIYVHWMYFAFLFSIPFLVIFVFNLLVACGVRKASINRPRCQMSAQQRGEAKTTLMLLVVVGVFFACNSLAWLLNGYEVLGYQPTDPAFEFVSDLNNLLVLAHPAFNIFVYARFSTKFRKQFLYCLCRCCHPSFAGSRGGSLVGNGSCDGYNYNGRRSSKHYAVLNSVVMNPGKDRKVLLSIHTTDKQQETCMSSSTIATTLTQSNMDHAASEPVDSVTRDLLEDNRKHLLETLGISESKQENVMLSDTTGTCHSDDEDGKLIFV